MTDLVYVQEPNGNVVRLGRDYAESVGANVIDVETDHRGRIVDTEVTGGWDAKLVDELKAEIDFRNASRPDDQRIQPANNRKAGLVAALNADDAAQAAPPENPEGEQ